MSVQQVQSFAEPIAAQHQFAQQIDMSDPDTAMSWYQRIMHEHTKQQFERATASSHRRSSKPVDRGSVSSESSNASMNSTSS